MMFRIPSISYNKYYKTYQPQRISNSITTPEQNRVNNSFGTLQVLSNLSVRSLKTQQDLYRKQVVDFNSKAKELNTAASKLTANDFFNQKNVTSTSPALTGHAEPTAKTTQYHVGITQMAAAQSNNSTALNSSASGALAAGIYAFGITYGSGVKKTLTVGISKSDNNSQILGRFAKEINDAKLGIKAEVKTNGTKSYLSLDSEKTGQTSSFTIYDIVGNAAQALTMNNTVTTAKDAIYTVNGKNMTSEQNKILLNDGNVELDINAVTNGTAKISIGMDTDKMLKGVGVLVDTYNKFSNQLAESSNLTQRSKKTLAGIETILTGKRAKDFQDIGITWDKTNNHLQLDEDKLNQALKQNADKVESLISGRAGLASMVKAISKNALSNPVSMYLKEPNMLDSINYGWLRSGTSFLYTGFNSTYQGMFFDRII